MDRLERLTQDEYGILHHADGKMIYPEHAILRGKIRNIVLENPCLDISGPIDKMTERKTTFIPDGVNAYVTSDFNGDTQHMRIGSNRMYSVYAIQFYYIHQK